LNEIPNDAAPAARQKPNRSGGAGRKGGEGEMNARPALAFAAAEFRANEVGAPRFSSLLYQIAAKN
jgi:hypothetical protein